MATEIVLGALLTFGVGFIFGNLDSAARSSGSKKSVEESQRKRPIKLSEFISEEEEEIENFDVQNDDDEEESEQKNERGDDNPEPREQQAEQQSSTFHPKIGPKNKRLKPSLNELMINSTRSDNDGTTTVERFSSTSHPLLTEKKEDLGVMSSSNQMKVGDRVLFHGRPATVISMGSDGFALEYPKNGEGNDDEYEVVSFGSENIERI